MGQTQSHPELKHQMGNKKKQTEHKETALVTDNLAKHLELYANYLNYLLEVRMTRDLIAIIFAYASYNPTILDQGLSLISTKNFRVGLFKPNQSYIVECKAQAEALVRDHVLMAGPLDGLATQVKNNPHAALERTTTTITLDKMVLTIIGSPLECAVMFLDQTITGPKTYEGQAEKLLSLIEELIPERLTEAREQVRLAAPAEDEDTSKVKKTEQLDLLNAAFDKIKMDKPDEARQIIRDYIVNSKPEVITNNQYFLNLHRLMSSAFRVLFTRVQEFKNELMGTQDQHIIEQFKECGAQAKQYYFKVIGTINRALPPKSRRVVNTGVFALLQGTGTIDYTSNVSDASYLSGDNGELGMNRFFDDVKRSGPDGHGALSRLVKNFEELFNKYISAVEHMLHLPQSDSTMTLSKR